MTAKEELMEYIYEQQRVSDTLEYYEKLKDRAEKVTSIMSDMPKGTNKEIQDSMAECIAEMADISNEYAKNLVKAEKARENVERKIEKVKQPFKNILFFRYVCGDSFEKIATKMGYDFKYICNLHGTALREFEKVVEKNG